MRKLAGLAFSGFMMVAASFFASPASAADCKLTLGAKIGVLPSPNGLLVPVKFGNVNKSLSLQLETASNALTQATVDELNIPVHPIPNFNLVARYNGEEVHKFAIAPLMSLAGLDLKKVEFLLTSKPRVAGTAGELGMAIFQNVDFELDPMHQTFNLFLPDHCPGQVVYWTQAPYGRIPFQRDQAGFVNLLMSLDGKPIRARVSSSGLANIGMNAMRRIFHIDTDSPLLKPANIHTGVAGLPETKVYEFDFKSLAGDGLSITNPEILVYDEPPRPQCQNQAPEPRTSIPGMGVHSVLLEDQCYGGYDVRLSAALLSRLHLYFATKEGMVYATAADAQ